MQPLKQVVVNQVPFVCQFSTPENAEPILTDVLDPNFDNQWSQSGALSRESYVKWVYTMCGMASLSMTLQYFFDQKIPPVILADDALGSGVYSEDEHGISNMKYREFVDWVKMYDIEAIVVTRFSLRLIKLILAQGGLVMVSVNPNIRGYDTADIKQKGGHMVLVTGYDSVRRTITINNSSGFSSLDSQKDHIVSENIFRNYFAGRGLILKKTKSRV